MILIILVLVAIASFLGEPRTAWAASSRDRVFLPLELSVIKTLELPKQTTQGQPIQSWTGLTYDRLQNQFYSLAIAEDSPAEVYLARLSLKQNPETSETPSLNLEALTPLQADGKPLSADQWHPHSVVLSPESTVFISGSQSGIQPDAPIPLVCEFAVESGQQKNCLKLPERYQLPVESSTQTNLEEQKPGENKPRPFLVPFGALAIASQGSMESDPFPLFTATEYPLPQDIKESEPSATIPVRWLQALLNSGDRPFWLAEYAYPVDAIPGNSLAALLTLGQSAQFLSVESSRNLDHPHTQIYQVTVSNATDTSRVDRLETLSTVKPLKKKPLLDLSALQLTQDWQVNDLSFGGQLPDGGQSIFLMGDRQMLWLELKTLATKRFATTSLPSVR